MWLWISQLKLKCFNLFLLYANSGTENICHLLPITRSTFILLFLHVTQRYSEITQNLLVLVAPPSALQFSLQQVEQAVCLSWYNNQDCNAFTQAMISVCCWIWFTLLIFQCHSDLIWFLRVCELAQPLCRLMKRTAFILFNEKRRLNKGYFYWPTCPPQYFILIQLCQLG